MTSAMAQPFLVSATRISSRSMIMTREGEVLGTVASAHKEHVGTLKSSASAPASRPIASATTTQQDSSPKDILQGLLAKTWNAWGSHKPTNSTVATLRAEEASLRRTRSGSTSTIETCSDGSAEYYADIDQRIAGGTHISQQSLFTGELYNGDTGSVTAKVQEERK